MPFLLGCTVAEETRNRLLSQQIEEMSVQQDQQFEQLSTLQREKLSYVTLRVSADDDELTLPPEPRARRK